MNKQKKLVLFDLDKTLITCDSLKRLVFFLFKRDFINFSYKFPSLILVTLKHLFSSCNHKTDTKSELFSIILKGYDRKQIKKFSIEFSEYIFFNFKSEKIYKILLDSKKLRSEIYIVTASGDFYCKFLAKLFSSKLISTKVNLSKKKLGKIIGKNCFGFQKKYRILKEIKNFKGKHSTFYTDSETDKPLLNACSKGYLVNY
jgi:phosphatidylglycerophosphatase C